MPRAARPATAASCAFAGWPVLGVGALAIALLAMMLRRKVIPKMDSVRTQIQFSGASAVTACRRIYTAAILINLIQLVLMVWSLIAASLSLR